MPSHLSFQRQQIRVIWHFVFTSCRHVVITFYCKIWEILSLKISTWIKICHTGCYKWSLTIGPERPRGTCHACMKVWCHRGCCWSWSWTVYLILLPRTYLFIKFCCQEFPRRQIHLLPRKFSATVGISFSHSSHGMFQPDHFVTFSNFLFSSRLSSNQQSAQRRLQIRQKVSVVNGTPGW